MYTIESLKKMTGRRIYIFGAGEAGAALAEELGGDIAFAGFLDNNPALAGASVSGLPVLRPETPGIPAADPLAIIASIVPEFIGEMRRQCRELGLDCLTHQELMANSHEGFADIWDDGESRETCRKLIRFFLSQDFADLPEQAANQYFQDFVPRAFYRSFVDGGAFVGDTLGAFRARFADDFDAYYAFEPDRRNFAALEAAAGGDPRIRLFNNALYDSEESIRFSESAVAWGSKIVDNGAELARCARLDAIFAEAPLPGFIKLDVECAEMKALAGAERTISRGHSALAVCVYHQISDFWTIPMWIKHRLPQCKLFLRHHGTSRLETVCYAVP